MFEHDHGSLNVPIEHPTIRYMVYNGYYKVMSNIPKMGHLPTPDDPSVLTNCRTVTQSWVIFSAADPRNHDVLATQKARA